MSLALDTHRSNSSNNGGEYYFHGDRSVRDVLDGCLNDLRKKSILNHHSAAFISQNLSIDSYVEYLHSEWLYTLSDLQLAYQDEQIWNSLRIPTRLKLELKKHILATDYGACLTDDDATLESPRSLSPRKPVLEDIHENPPTKPTTCDVWVKCYSEEHNYYYYYNNITHETQWECPDESKLYKIYDAGDGTNQNQYKNENAWYEEKEASTNHDQDHHEYEEYYGGHYDETGQWVYDDQTVAAQTGKGEGEEEEEGGVVGDYEPELCSEDVVTEAARHQSLHSLSPADPLNSRLFLKPLAKDGRTIFAESPLSNLSTVHDHETPRSRSNHPTRDSDEGLVPSNLEEEYAEEKEDDPHPPRPLSRNNTSGKVVRSPNGNATYIPPVKLSPARSINGSSDDESSESDGDYSNYFVVSASRSPVPGLRTSSNGSNHSRVQVPPLPIHPEALHTPSSPMMSREDFLCHSNDTYSINLRDLAIGDSDSSDPIPQPRQKEKTAGSAPHLFGQKGKKTPMDNLQRLSDQLRPLSARLQAGSGGNPRKEKKEERGKEREEKEKEKGKEEKREELRKKSSATKKMFKFMNSIVGSKGNNGNGNGGGISGGGGGGGQKENNRGNGNAVEVKAELVKHVKAAPAVSSEFSQTLRRIEQDAGRSPLSTPVRKHPSKEEEGWEQGQGQGVPRTPTAEDFFLQYPASSGSAELNLMDVYPKVTDEANNSKLIAGVNSLNTFKRGSFSDPVGGGGGGGSVVNSGRTTLDSQRTIPPLEDSNCVIYNLPLSTNKPVPTIFLRPSRSGEDTHSEHTGTSTSTGSRPFDPIARSGSGSGSHPGRSKNNNNSSNNNSSSSSYGTPSEISNVSGEDAAATASLLNMTDVNTFLVNMQALGFTEKQCNRSLDACNNHIMQAAALLLEEGAAPGSGSPEMEDEKRKKRSKLKKSMFKFFPYDI